MNCSFVELKLQHENIISDITEQLKNKVEEKDKINKE